MNQLLRTVVVSVAIGITAAAEPSPTVPAGTRVQVKLLKMISSQSSHLGETVQFEVAHDVVMEGLVVISRGTPAVGSVTNVKAYPGHQPWWSNRQVSPGRLGFTISATRDVDGNIIRLSGPLRRDQTPRRLLISWYYEGEMFDAIVLSAR